jgi:hypothetical protein
MVCFVEGVALLLCVLCARVRVWCFVEGVVLVLLCVLCARVLETLALCSDEHKGYKQLYVL